jgi:hypothetical protein
MRGKAESLQGQIRGKLSIRAADSTLEHRAESLPATSRNSPLPTVPACLWYRVVAQSLRNIKSLNLSRLCKSLGNTQSKDASFTFDHPWLQPQNR